MNKKKLSRREFIKLTGITLVILALSASGVKATVTPTTTAPTEAPTIIPTPAPIEVAPGLFIPASQIVGYEARDNSGKLTYVEDTHGNWIKATHEVIVTSATAKDWTNVNTRLGSDFVINTDGTITGVEGLIINKANGEVTFYFNGKGPENYHIGNIKIQEINGVKRLLVAGYSWNPESKSWEVFNPGFPMESPETQLGWFTKADAANGNWLRWHQRAIKDTDIDLLKTVGIKPDVFGTFELKGMRPDVPGSVIHYTKLVWHNSQLKEINGNKMNTKKEQYPGRAGLSYGYLIDSSTVLISFDALNGDGSVTSFPMIMDDTLWKEHRQEMEFTRAALASGHEWDQSMKKDTTGSYTNRPENWMFWPDVSVYPDATISSQYGTDDIVILKDPDGIARREAAIQDNKIISSGSLELWGASIYVNVRK